MCLYPRLPSLPLVSFFAPIPPTRARRALFPGGEGGDFRLFYARGCAPCIPAPEPARRWEMGANHAPCGGRAPARHLFALPPRCLVGGRGGFGRLSAAAFSLLFCPLSPRPPSPVGKGENITLFRRGLPPPAPRALNRLRHLQSLPSGYQTGVCPRRRQFGAKLSEPPFYWQCRQPRRGGTGGEELRRLRWSSPPGQG